ncbi:triose-phosphate isomerase [Petrachloros mirabilis]
MRKPLVVGNWKMNKTASEAASFVRELLAKIDVGLQVEIVIAPPYTALESVRTALGSSTRLGIGAQNLHWEQHGAFTGEISGPMLRDLSCSYVILGHSERRKLFGERDADINKKVRAALISGLRPILCVGESLEEREGGRTQSVVTGQVIEGLKGLTTQEMAPVTIAYEPVWAIGTGRAATTEQAVAVHQTIRSCIAKQWSPDAAKSIRILYGGSVTPQNAGSLLTADEIDGALVGGACLKAESFATIALVAKVKCAN